MKRKRGHKKKKAQKLRMEATNSAEVIAKSPINNNEDDNDNENDSSSSDEEIDDNVNNNSHDGDENPSVEAPAVVINSEPLPREPERVVSIRPDGVFQRPPPMAVYGRVRVKLKTAVKPPPSPQLQPQPQSRPQPPLVESKVRDGEGVRVGSEVDKSKVEVRVENKEETGGGGGEKVVEESGNSGSVESKKSGGMGIKIVSSKKEDGGGGEKVVEEKGDLGSASGGMGIKIVSSKKEDGGGGGCEKVVEESGNSGSAESKRSGGMGIKIVSVKSSSLSPSGVNAKEKIVLLKSASLSPPGGNAKERIVSSKSSSLSPPGGDAKESGESRASPEVDEGERVVVKEEKPKSLNKQELEASLEVIKKVMKMDAAEPFNVPVNPIELGIPDYFDVIDTPMDFGTIHNNLESGTKYMDSEDVYKDAQYIWDNCFKYNNKGDYIVDLMKRVKKNFMKYWVAAGLYTEQTKKMIDGEGTTVDEPTTSGFGKKFKKGKGYKRHKDDCLCAICIMKRRRREREAREAEEAREAGIIAPSPQARVLQTSMTEEYKREENSQAESPGEDTSSYMETSPDGDADADMEDGETRLEGVVSQYDNQLKAGDDRIEFHDKSDRSGDISGKLLRNDKGDNELYSHDDTGSRMTIDAQKQSSVHPEDPASGYLKQRHELLELEKKRQRLRLLETFRDLENPMLSGLCGTLFPNNAQSVWNGANSLLRCQKFCNQKIGIHEAVASFVSPSCKSASSLK